MTCKGCGATCKCKCSCKRLIVRDGGGKVIARVKPGGSFVVDATTYTLPQADGDDGLPPAA